jgi:hypothetical protein
MTNFTKNFLAAAASLVFAGVVSAQPIKADIPFAFRIGNRLMQPGPYEITKTTSAVPIYRLLNVNQRDAALALAGGGSDPGKAWKADGRPRLTFECGETSCALAGIWEGAGEPARAFVRPKNHGEPLHTMVIVARPANAD